MRSADVLATAASTFSFSAAMLAHNLAPEIAPEVAPPPPSTPPCGGARPGRFWRPDPAAGALVEFDPWAAPVLLNACHSGTRFRKEAHAAACDP